MITAKVIADSISEIGHRLTTIQLKYPRFIHAEFMTHRMFSRSASSSRAVPIKRVMQEISNKPATPIEWGLDQPGMQASTSQAPAILARHAWYAAANAALREAERMRDMGVHKQIVNRILEPYMHIDVVVTATEWDNFFHLRISDKAQPEMRALAEAMRDAMDASEPRPVRCGEWHLPYLRDDEPMDAEVSAARCARVSYLNHDQTAPDVEKDVALARRLLKDQHMSPFEHQARPLGHGGWCANFRGWESARSALR